MKAREIREGDIVEIDYVTEFTKEHMNEGKALVIWKGFNNQPLVRKLDTKAAIWTCYEHIARVVGHVDIEGYMDKALSIEPCEDCISREEALMALTGDVTDCTVEEYIARLREKLSKLPSVGKDINVTTNEDCISRQAVLEGIAEWVADGYADSEADISHISSLVTHLPSVTPKEKTGRWISFGIQGEIDGQIVKAFVCSECGAISIFRVSNGNIVNGDLCPNCGAKMVEPQESEEQDETD